MTTEKAKLLLDQHYSAFSDDIKCAIDLAMTSLEAIERINSDGCSGCKYGFKDEFEMPCVMCKRSKKDFWKGDANDE